MKRTYLFIGSVIVQLVLLFALLGTKLMVLGGTTVYFRIAPVDPRSPLRGDYVTFQLEDLSLLSSSLSGASEIRGTPDVYVLLRNSGAHWVPVAVSEKPIAADGNMFEDAVQIKGKVKDNQLSERYFLRVEYGIESYFIPEGSGTRLPPGSKVAVVKISDTGDAVLSGIMMDGKPWP